MPPKTLSEAIAALVPAALDAAVMARLRPPFGCEFIPPSPAHDNDGRWRIHDANDDAIASVSGAEEGYARMIVQALNAQAARRARRAGAAPDLAKEDWSDLASEREASSVLHFTADAETRRLVLRSIRRAAQALEEMDQDAGESPWSPQEEKVFANRYARFLALVTGFPIKPETVIPPVTKCDAKLHNYRCQCGQTGGSTRA